MQNLLFTFSEGKMKYLCVTFDKLTDKHDKVKVKKQKQKTFQLNDREVVSRNIVRFVQLKLGLYNLQFE